MRTSTNTTAGSARSTKPTNGLSGRSPLDVVAESVPRSARGARGRSKPALSTRPITTPTTRIRTALR